jgi:hypothetical protein
VRNRLARAQALLIQTGADVKLVDEFLQLHSPPDHSIINSSSSAINPIDPPYQHLELAETTVEGLA